MQLTRAFFIVALAASTANALPTARCNMAAAECAGAPERNEGSLSGISDAVEKRSHRPGHVQSNSVSDGNEREARSNPKDSVAQLNSENSRGHQKEANSIFNGQQSKETMQVVNTAESRLNNQDSARSPAHNEMSMSSSQQADRSPGNTERNNAVDKSAAASKNTKGFTLRIRELIHSLSQGRKQTHGEQDSSKNVAAAEPSIGIREDRARINIPSSENKVVAMEQHTQNQGTENTISQSSPHERDTTRQDTSRVTIPKNSNVARSYNTARPEEDGNMNLNHDGQPHSGGMFECLRTAMGNIHKQSLCVSSEYTGSGQSRA
ncbi:hypothetical protein N658DRAFT_510613 [Parathielavia hyrcaniae]|uniref:Uncharacterized protein n=1 Tax=Parathielavia hyrcaniae TaxID=113614 RepID=A0AAN6PX61_9PEZI|nr:hypothetical protein N658DRAFT_510613 [Parathielavia hyrcaniae]